jgi:hypothetical protein
MRIFGALLLVMTITSAATALGEVQFAHKGARTTSVAAR